MQPNRYTEIYLPLHEQAMELQNKYYDFTGGKFEHPQAFAIHHEIKELVSDIDLRRDPKSIEHRIKTIQGQLGQAQHSGQPFLNFQHYEYLHTNYGHMRTAVQKIVHET